MKQIQMNYKSDFNAIIGIEGGWGVPFKAKFWAGTPSRSYCASWDGADEYINCHREADGRICFAFDNHNLGTGKLMLELTFYLDNTCFRDGICSEVIPSFAPVFVDENGEEYTLTLDYKGMSTLTTIGTLPAFYQKGDSPAITTIREGNKTIILSDGIPIGEVHDGDDEPAIAAAARADAAADRANYAFTKADTAANRANSSAESASAAAARADEAAVNADASSSQALASASTAGSMAALAESSSAKADASSARAEAAATLANDEATRAHYVAESASSSAARANEAATKASASTSESESQTAKAKEATTDANVAAQEAADAAYRANDAAHSAQVAVAEASNVNAVLNGDNLTVTDRQGNSVTRNVRGPKGDSITMFPNVTIFGQPTIQESQISNFSADNYLQFPFVVDFAGRPWQIDCAITTGSNVSQQHNVLDSAFGLAFAFSGGKFILALSSDGTSWNLGATSGTHTILANTTYYIRISWNGSVYKLAYSTDKETWVDDITVTSSASLASKQIIIGKSLDNRYIFNGSINMSEAHLTISGKIVWEGMDDAGLATRMAIDMSNIDDEGKQRLNDIAMQGAVGDAIKELQSLFGNGVEGYVRVSGVSDPAFNYRSYKHEVGAESVFDCLKPCLVGNNFTGRVGEILHVLNPLNWYETEDGRTVKLDATEGEVMICPTKPMYGISGHVTFGTVTYDVFLRSFVPFEWHGHPAEKIAPVGWSPSYTVAHKDDDNVTRMHSCYNPAFEGSYSAQQGIVGAFVQTQNEDGTISEQYDGTAALFGGAGGLHTTDLALYTGEQYAMNLNEDTMKTFPYMNRTAQCEELMFGNMLAEGGTFDAHNLSLMGSGFCSNDNATLAAHWEESNADARNGFRYVKQDGTWGYYSIGSNADFGYGATGDNLYKACMLNSWRSPWKCMEQQRVMIYAISNNIPELTWFAFEGNKYKWRHVDGFEGPSNGAMTCVVWKHFSSKLVQGCVEPGTTKDVSGNRCEFLICSALYRGVITDVSPSWWTSGLIFTQDADGTMFAYVQRDQKLLLKSPSTTSRATDAEPWPFENSYVAAGDYANSNGYIKDFNDAALMLPKNRATQTGAGLHTYVGAYKYLGATKPSSGFSLRGFRRGGSAAASYLSPLYVGGNYSPSNTSAIIAFGICCEIESRGL